MMDGEKFAGDERALQHAPAARGLWRGLAAAGARASGILPHSLAGPRGCPALDSLADGVRPGVP